MLPVFSQFILRQAIRTPLYLLNPNVIPHELVSLPRFSVIHYLDTKQNNHFPVRDLYYFRDIPKNKKIPIFHITDLESKTETTTLENKMALAEVRKWNQANVKHFKAINLLESPNSDSNLIAIYNYNILKDLYKYKTSMQSTYYKFFNLNYTYWSTVKKAVNADKDSIHFVSIDLPNNIPNFNIINMILKFNIVKYTRIVSDTDLLHVIDLYKWLVENTRPSSSMLEITDEESKRIVVEFKYKGYSCFLPLYVIRGMSKESSLESDVKISDSKIQKLFILMLYKVQDKVNTLLEQNIPEEEVRDETDKEQLEEIKEEDIDDDNDINVEDDDYIGVQEDNDINTQDDSNVSDSLPDISRLAKIKNKDIDIENIYKDLEVENFDNLIDKEITKFELNNEEVDNLYEETILKVEQESDTETKEDPVLVNHSQEEIEKILSNKTVSDRFDRYIQEAVKFKILSPSEIRSLKKAKEERTLLKSPYDKDIPLDAFKNVTSSDIELTSEEMKIDVKNNLITDDLKKEVINKFDKKYIDKVLRKDIVACISHLENSNLIIRDYTIEESKTALGNYEIHKLTIKPFNARESTIYFKLPKIDKEGEFVASGVKCRLRKQRTDLPIRKISPTKVALTSNYGKLFIFRTERKANDPYDYLANFIRNNYINEEGLVTKIIPGGRNLNHLKLPNIYHYLSSQFTEIHTTKFSLLLNYNEQRNYVSEDILKDINARNLVFCGYLPNKHILVVDFNDIFYDYTDKMTKLGTIDELLELDSSKVPKPYSVIKLLGDNIPLGVCMAYYLGLNELISVTGTKATVIESNKHYKLNKDELVLKFSDFKLILKIPNKETELLFNGFLYYKDFIKQHSIREFSYKDIYLNLLEFREGGLIHIKELNLLEELFLDPITVDVLRSINEPTDYFKLLLRANELLRDFSHPDINDPNYSRIRGYDRIPGLMYKALTESIRDFRFKRGGRNKIELDPYKVWNYVTQDNTKKISEDVNPVLDVKEAEIVTLSGLDGLDKDATPKLLRRYHKNDIGLVSEATVDSSDVALNVYLTPYAKIKNIRGLIDIDNKESQENRSKVFSTSVLLAPMSEYDDPKRINFVNIQNSHTISSKGYMQPIIRTGFEYIMPYKVGSLYCTIAKDNGDVVGKTDKLLTVKYENGEVEGIPLGNRYGRMEGTVYPHSLVTELNVGDKFKKNDYLAYNENFFERDWLDPSRLIMKFGRNITVALTMNEEVFEDSSAISSELSKQMTTTVVKERIFIFEFNKNIVNILPEGTAVEPNTVLFTVVDENTDYSNLSESTIEMLQNLASLSPKAKVYGVIDRYEVKYNGDVSDMSPSIRRLVNRLDKLAHEETKGTEYEITSNRVTSEYRSEGKNLNVNTLELKVFIRIDVAAAVGDKGVFANQMKSIVSDVYTSTVTTESGTRVDAMFSYKGILNRIVNSPILIGTTSRLIKHVSKKAAEVYFNNK